MQGLLIVLIFAPHQFTSIAIIYAVHHLCVDGNCMMFIVMCLEEVCW